MGNLIPGGIFSLMFQRNECLCICLCLCLFLIQRISIQCFVCQKRRRVMSCFRERSLLSGVLLQRALLKDSTPPPSTWLWQPMRKFWCRFHSLITGTLIHPLSCCKVRDAAPQLPPPADADECMHMVYSEQWLNLLRHLCSCIIVNRTPCFVWAALFNVETEVTSQGCCVWMVTNNPLKHWFFLSA